MRKQPLHPYTAIINKKQKNESKKLREQALNWLTKKFPESFDVTDNIRPLKVGILKDILEHAVDAKKDGISVSKLREALVIFTRRIDYLVCIKAKEMRIDLFGNPTTQVTQEEMEKAALKLKRRVEKTIRSSRSPSSSPNAKPRTPSTNNYPVQDHIASYSGQTETTKPTPPTTIIKRKTTKQFDPDSVARLKAKLGLGDSARSED